MHSKRLAIFFLVLYAIGVVATVAQSDKDNGKKNERPGKPSVSTAVAPDGADATMIYEFSRPGFLYQKVTIRLNDNGRGDITFERNDAPEPICDPVVVSPKTVDSLRAAFDALDMPVSTPDLQYSRDYSHLGEHAFTRKLGGKHATVKFNWTESKEGRVLMDEFRKISNEFTWRFEMQQARESQPLRTPVIMGQVDKYLARGEISDPANIVGYLKELSLDERLPLIARNHADRLIKRIEKSSK